jgi:hypothetical protein
VSVVISEFEVVPEERRERAQPAQQAPPPPPGVAQLRHEIEATLRLLTVRAERLRAD